MAKDISDFTTVDFIDPVMPVVCGQVLMDRQRRVAIVVKKSQRCAQLIRVRSGKLRLEKCGPEEISADWVDTQYPFGKALAKLMGIGQRQGITEGAKIALEGLLKMGKEPKQGGLF